NHAAELDQVVHHFPRHRSWRGKADALPAAVTGKDGGIDADQVAARVDQGAAGVAAIDRRIGLDKALEGGNAEVAAAGGTDNAHGYGGAETERIADGEDDIATRRRGL